MRDWQELVKEFYIQNGYEVGSYNITANDAPWWIKRWLKICGKALYRIGRLCLYVDKLAAFLKCRHSLLFRCHLIMEEVGETVIAIAEGDEVETADGIADSIYVILGLSIMTNIPTNTIIKEVHRSNLTKRFIFGVDGRVKSIYKRGDYSAPDIKGALLIGRALGTGGTSGC